MRPRGCVPWRRLCIRIVERIVCASDISVEDLGKLGVVSDDLGMTEDCGIECTQNNCV